MANKTASRKELRDASIERTKALLATIEANLESFGDNWGEIEGVVDLENELVRMVEPLTGTGEHGSDDGGWDTWVAIDCIAGCRKGSKATATVLELSRYYIPTVAGTFKVDGFSVPKKVAHKGEGCIWMVTPLVRS